VVELEDDWIALAAIDARMLTQEAEHMCAERDLASPFGGARLVAMELTPRTEVRGEAGSAPPLVAFSEAVEQLQRKLVPATAAMP
jgi:hypothetical protein